MSDDLFVRASRLERASSSLILTRGYRSVGIRLSENLSTLKQAYTYTINGLAFYSDM
jgi:hypothetical protein